MSFAPLVKQVTPAVVNVYATKTEQGFQSPSPDRVGPFDTHEEAEHALEKLRENSARWAEEDRRNDA